MATMAETAVETAVEPEEALALVAGGPVAVEAATKEAAARSRYGTS